MSLPKAQPIRFTELLRDDGSSKDTSRSRRDHRYKYWKLVVLELDCRHPDTILSAVMTGYRTLRRRSSEVTPSDQSEVRRVRHLPGGGHRVGRVALVSTPLAGHLWPARRRVVDGLGGAVAETR